MAQNIAIFDILRFSVYATSDEHMEPPRELDRPLNSYRLLSAKRIKLELHHRDIQYCLYQLRCLASTGRKSALMLTKQPSLIV